MARTWPLLWQMRPRCWAEQQGVWAWLTWQPKFFWMRKKPKKFWRKEMRLCVHCRRSRRWAKVPVWRPKRRHRLQRRTERRQLVSLRGMIAFRRRIVSAKSLFVAAQQFSWPATGSSVDASQKCEKLGTIFTHSSAESRSKDSLNRAEKHKLLRMTRGVECNRIGFRMQ